MLLAHYRHRLPADYDLARIGERIAARGPSWDAVPGLVFKAFVLGDRSAGAETTAYASLYLWRDAEAAAAFLAGPGFESVVATFGRPQIETWLPWAIELGAAPSGTSLAQSDRLILEGSDLGPERRGEAAWARATAREPGVFAAIVGLDPDGWRMTRFVLGSDRPAQEGERMRGAIVHLARPGIAALRVEHR